MIGEIRRVLPGASYRWGRVVFPVSGITEALEDGWDGLVRVDSGPDGDGDYQVSAVTPFRGRHLTGRVISPEYLDPTEDATEDATEPESTAEPRGLTVEDVSVILAAIGVLPEEAERGVRLAEHLAGLS